MTATVPWLPRFLLVEWAYGVLGPHRWGDQALTEGYVAVVACAQDDHDRLAPALAPLVPARVLSSATVQPARRAA
jgi:hypothetical protein